MDWFLRAKHWQIFMLVFVIPVILEIAGIVAVVLSRSPVPVFIIMPLMLFCFLYGQFGWMYSIGTRLQEKLPPEGRMNVKRFKVFMLVPVIYFLLLFVFIGLVAFSLNLDEGPSPLAFIPLIVIIPLHFFSIFCIFYGLWFVAKTIKAVEYWRPVHLGDYIGDFFLIWFFIIGIWFIQPRINRMFPEHQYPPQR